MNLNLTDLASVLKEKYKIIGPWAAFVSELEAMLKVWRQLQRRDAFVFVDAPEVARTKTRTKTRGEERLSALQERMGKKNQTLWYGIEHDRDGLRIALGFEMFNGDDIEGGIPYLMYQRNPFFLMLGKGGAKPAPKHEPGEAYLEVTRYDNAKRMNETSVCVYETWNVVTEIHSAFDWWRARWGEAA